jgi:hypothetical protein
MTGSFRDAVQRAARGEPAVGDPYARFLRRRRRSRGLRTLLGVVVAAGTMFGFVRVFPGGTGGTPNDGFIPGAEVQPPIEPFERFSHEPLALEMLIPSDWLRTRDETSARIGPSLAASGAPDEIELRFGALGACEVEECVALADAVADPEDARAKGVRIEPATLRIGSLSEEAHAIAYDADEGDAIAPWCTGCVGYYAELGTSDLPMLILARDERTLRANRDLLDQILRTVTVA